MHFSTVAVTSLLTAIVSAQANFVCTYRLKPQKPEGARCGFNGAVLNPQYLDDPVSTPTQEDCLNSCQFDRRCQSYSYDTTGSGTCTRYTADVNDMSPQAKPKTGVLFYGRICYKPATTKPRNPINVNFEDGLENFTPDPVEPTNDTSVTLIKGFKSAQGAQILAKNGGRSSILASYNSCEGATYSLSFNMKRLFPSFGPSNNSFNYVVADGNSGQLITSGTYFLPTSSGSDNGGRVQNRWYPISTTFAALSNFTAVAFVSDATVQSGTVQFVLDNVNVVGRR